MKQNLFLKRITDFKSVRTLLNRQGQAVVEYVLLMIVTLSLLLAFKGVVSSMDAFMSDFMGEYIVCLMEYGELPSLGVEEADLKNHTAGTGKKCEFRKFSAGLATNSAGKNGTASTVNGQNGDSSKNSSTSASADKNSKDENSKSTNDSGFKPNSRKSSPYTNGQINRAGSSGVAEAPSNTVTKVIEEDEEAGPKGRRRNNNRTRQAQEVSGQNGYRGISGKLAAELEKKSKLYPRRPSSKSTVLTEEGYRFVPYKKVFNPPKSNSAYIAANEEEFTIGNFMKWLVIAGILIACFILFGGQVLNYTNSSEK